MKYGVIGLAFLLSFAFSVELVLAKTIVGEARYRYGDSESLLEAKDKCRILALKRAIESFAIYVESFTRVTQLKLERHYVMAVSEGLVRNVKVTHETEEGNIVYIRVSGEVDEEGAILGLVRKRESLRKSAESQVPIYTDKNFNPLFKNSYLSIIKTEIKEYDRIHISVKIHKTPGYMHGGFPRLVFEVYDDKQKVIKSSHFVFSGKDYIPTSYHILVVRGITRQATHVGNFRLWGKGMFLK